MSKLSTRELLEAYKKRFSATDAQIGQDIGAARSVIAEARNSTQELKLEFRLRLAARLGHVWEKQALRHLVDD